MERIDISVPAGLKEKAHSNGINISKICVIALTETIEKLERKTVEPARVD